MTSAKTFPIPINKVRQIVAKYPTPFYVYDEKGITATAAHLNQTFQWAPGFTNYFAVKALPNPAILKLVKAAGVGADCSSLAELVLAERAGFSGERIMFTSNDTTREEFIKAEELGAIINLDDIGHIDFLEDALGHLPAQLCFRFNPGAERTGNQIIGNPSESKFGLTKPQLLEAYRTCRDKGVTKFGLHTMLASNELESDYFIQTARMLFDLAVEIKDTLGISLEFINLGGGFGIPYQPDQSPLPIAKVSSSVEQLYNEILRPHDLQPHIYMECGRYITGPHGYLVSTVLHVKHTYRDYVGLDASMANLMRPGVYGAYHHITVIGKENQPANKIYDIVGSLCENNDKFATQRQLPAIVPGDLVVLHDVGAHGHSMGFNYNGKLRSAELLLKADNNVTLIRRAETLDDYFATLSIG